MSKPTYKFNPETEAAVIRQIVADPSVLPKFHRHLRADGFEAAESKTLVSGALAYFKANGRAPTWVALMQELRERLNAGRLRADDFGRCAAFLEEARERPPLASEYVVDLVLGRERSEALWLALEEGSKLHVAGARDAAKLDEIVRVVAKADAIGKVDQDMGVDVLDDLDARTRAREETKQPKRWGCGIPDLDDLMDGGPSLDNPLGCIEAGPKQGKSLALGHISLSTAALGGVAVHFSMENGKAEVLKRMDAAVAGIPIREVHQRAREVDVYVRRWWTAVRARGGRLHVAKLPQRTTTVKDLEAYLDILAIEEALIPDVVVVDYPKEMSATNPEGLEKHEQLEEIYSELRSLGERRRHIVWTAAQLKAAGLEKRMAGRGDTGNALAIEQLVDVMVAIGRTAEEEKDHLARFGIAASRFCQSGTSTAPLSTAYDQGRILANFIPGVL